MVDWPVCGLLAADSHLGSAAGPGTQKTHLGEINPCLGFAIGNKAHHRDGSATAQCGRCHHATLTSKAIEIATSQASHVARMLASF